LEAFTNRINTAAKLVINTTNQRWNRLLIISTTFSVINPAYSPPDPRVDVVAYEFNRSISIRKIDASGMRAPRCDCCDVHLEFPKESRRLKSVVE
jgi:hypothetical protein